MNDTVRKAKLQRIRDGRPPRLMDLFAGCGGLSVGFAAEGFDPVAAVELDPFAAASHAYNLHRCAPEDVKAIFARPRDIVTTEPAELLLELGHEGGVSSAIDVVVGGPPCQSFARVGRAKLREIAQHPSAFLEDPRSNLYLRFLHYVRELLPLAILMENVPDILNYGGHNIAEETCEYLSTLGYVCRYTLLNSVYFGVPQMRERAFILAIWEGVGRSPAFPTPTHWIDLPKGYEGSRQVALQTVSRNPLFGCPGHYAPHPGSDRTTSIPAVTAGDAIGDLPPIREHLNGMIKRGARRFTTLARYLDVKIGPYCNSMRQWPGFEAQEDGVFDHVIRSLPRDYAIFGRMQPGDQYPQAHKIAQELFYEKLYATRRAGKDIVDGSPEYDRMLKETVPPYDPGKFPNKWRKMERDQPARTLMAHLGKDGYSHIHYDDSQSRTISVREAARLQSFPDGFRFEGTMNPAFRQIGNAVPPLLAKAFASRIRRTIAGQ